MFKIGPPLFTLQPILSRTAKQLVTQTNTISFVLKRARSVGVSRPSYKSLVLSFVLDKAQVFNVTWEQTGVFLPPLPYLPAFMAALKDIQRVLSTWHCHQLQYQPRLLAIPLCHFYQRHISFADLKNKDRLIAALFKSIDTIDVFLVAPLADNRTTPPKPVGLRVAFSHEAIFRSW